jgi:hypothetical protein
MYAASGGLDRERVGVLPGGRGGIGLIVALLDRPGAARAKNKNRARNPAPGLGLDHVRGTSSVGDGL